MPPGWVFLMTINQLFKPAKRSDVAEAPVAAGVRGRALLIGSLLVAATAVLVTQAELVVSSIHIGYLQFPPVALGLLLIASGLNRGMRAISKRFDLCGADLLVIYCMVLVAAMVSSHGIVQKWIPLLVTPNYFASAVNNWHGLFDPHIQRRLVPYDPHVGGQQVVSTAYYNGMHHGEQIPWSLWIGPLLNWGILIGLVVFAFLCVATILRKQWIDNEKLSFPLAQLPLEIAGGGDEPAFFKNDLTWCGAAIPIILFGLKGLHQMDPVIPDVLTPISINDYLKLPPWNGIGGMPLTFSFAALGFFFLLPADVLFSIWFFFVLTRIEELVFIAYNVPTPGMPMFPPKLFTGYQTMGAYFVLVGYLLWIARPHLKKVWAAAIGREKVDDSSEVMPYRVAVWGLIGSVAASALWLWSMGMSLWLAVFELVVLIGVIAVVMARSTAEAGMLMTETTFRPIDIYRMFGSIHALGGANLTMLAFVDNLLLRDQRGLLLTGMLDSMRISDGTKIRRRSFAAVLVYAILLSTVIAVVLNIQKPYELGAVRLDGWMEQGSPQLSWNEYQSYFSAQQVVDPAARWQMPVFFCVGIVSCLFLTIMRTTFYWWPLHPLGYALAGSWTTIVFWFPCLVAWVCKSLCIRYGGMGFYGKARPFFLGMILGEFGMAVFFVLLNLLFKTPVPAFPWS